MIGIGRYKYSGKIRIVLLLALGGITLSSCPAKKIWKSRHSSDELHFAETPSGWKLALYRYLPEKGTEKRNYPVIVCHGISSNKWMLDLDPEHSIALFLKKRGFDVWMLNLRGNDLSTQINPLGGKYGDFTFDDYVNEDVPTAIKYVLEHTGKNKVHWIGHSMGGMVIYAYAGTHGDNLIQSFVAIGSPLVFNHPSKFWNLTREYTQLAYGFRYIPMKDIAHIGTIIGHIPTDVFEYTIWNRENFTLEQMRKLLALSVDNIAGGVIRQFARMVDTGKFTSADGKVDYFENMTNIKIPVFFVVGGMDNLAPYESVIPAYRKVSSKDKKLEVFSIANGYSTNFGHVDLAVGDHATADVYPQILKWLVKHD